MSEVVSIEWAEGWSQYRLRQVHAQGKDKYIGFKVPSSHIPQKRLVLGAEVVRAFGGKALRHRLPDGSYSNRPIPCSSRGVHASERPLHHSAWTYGNNYNRKTVYLVVLHNARRALESKAVGTHYTVVAKVRTSDAIRRTLTEAIDWIWKGAK